MNPVILKTGACLRPKTPELKNCFLEIKKAFEKQGIEVLIESESAAMIGTRGIAFEEMGNRVDALLSLGGDGTLISVIRRGYANNLPTLGINSGHLGFLTAGNPHEAETFASLLAKGQYVIDMHMMLEARIESKDGIKTIHALNEVLISKKNISGMIKIYAKIENELFNTYHVDALIVGTPTGSTAYNVSAGGSVVHPFCKNILLTPVCAHSLTQRPMVLSDEFELRFRAENDCLLVIDGQETADVRKEDVLRVKAALHPAKLIQKPSRSYFKVLKAKFKWGEE